MKENRIPQYSLVPKVLLDAVERVRRYGIKKYHGDNWKRVTASEYREALGRHVISYLNGETVDKESGISTLAHIGANVGFLLTLEGFIPNEEPDIDDSIRTLYSIFINKRFASRNKAVACGADYARIFKDHMTEVEKRKGSYYVRVSKEPTENRMHNFINKHQNDTYGYFYVKELI